MEENLKKHILLSKGLAIISWVFIVLVFILSINKPDVLGALPVIFVAAVVFTFGYLFEIRKLKEIQQEKQKQDENENYLNR